MAAFEGVKLQPDRSYLIEKYEIEDRKMHKAPLYVPFLIKSCEGEMLEVPILETVTFPNLPGYKYNLVACGLGGNGHAIAILNENITWNEYDDAQVGPISEVEAFKKMKEQALIFIYRLAN